MGYSRYFVTVNTTSSGGVSHTISNPDNAGFSWISADHIKVYLSSANQTLSDFKTAISNGTVSLFNPSDGYTLSGSTLTFSGLSASSEYQIQIKRVTPKLNHVVDFQAGAPITETDLDNCNKYTLFRSQELDDEIAENLVSLAVMKTKAGIEGDFVDTDSVQTLKNKTFVAESGVTSNFDGGTFTGS